MTNRWKRKVNITFTLLITIIFTLSSFTSLLSTKISASSIYTKASPWAIPEIQEAYNNGLIPTRLIGSDMTKPTTREELCELAVRFYESLSLEPVFPASPNPFTDTSNPEVLKASALGITSGVTPTLFAPYSFTNREQVATMFSRTLRLLYPTTDYTYDPSNYYSDQTLISSWALDHVLYMSKVGFLKGSSGKFMPRGITSEEIASGYGTTKREEAIAISIRMYKNFSNTLITTDDTNDTNDTNNPFTDTTNSELGEKDLYIKSLIYDFKPIFTLNSTRNLGTFLPNGDLYEESGLFRPTYSPLLTLSAENGYNTDGSKTYSSSPYSSIIKSSGDGIHEFKIDLPTQTKNSTNKIIWQIGRVPFNGNPIGYISQTPKGLLQSGQLSSNSTSFTINFNSLNLPTTGLFTYYVRAYPIDSSGASIGDCGSGLPVLYGEPKTTPTVVSDSGFFLMKLLFSLKPAKNQGTVYFNGEYPNNFQDISTVYMSTGTGKLYSFLPENFPTNTQELRIQVSSLDYSGSSNNHWESPKGLEYEESIFPGDPLYDLLISGNSFGWPLDFSKWAPVDSKLPDKNIPYYIRVIAFTKGSTSGSVNPFYSETIRVNYGKPGASSFQYYPEVKVNANIPTVSKIQYVHPKFESYDWQYHYIVFRQPTYGEVFPFYIGSKNNDLFPGMPINTKLDFTPVEENKSWWEEAWDAVVEFFTDLVNIVASLTNWVSSCYANLKAELITFVANTLPIPDGWKGPLTVALTAMVDYGLASVGIPPSLPNFDELSEMGADYLTQVALEQANIPPSIITEEIKTQLEEGITELAKDSTNSSTLNPLGYNFIKFDPYYLYQPAYIMIDLTNNSGSATATGYLSGDIIHYIVPEQRNWPDEQYLIAKFDTVWFNLFKPVHGQIIPSIQPGESLTVPIFLEPYADIKMPGTNVTVTYNDFARIYSLEDFEFNFVINYDLIPAEEAAQLQNITGEAIYTYYEERTNISFDGKSYLNYTY